MERRRKAEEEDYGDYVTRCICDFKHDDGYMICCDECSVWQHVECMQVDPKNLPDNYLCEECEPRPVDKRRARQAQLKKRENLSDADDARERRGQGRPLLGRLERRKSSSNSSLPPIPLGKKKRKKGKIIDAKPEISKRQRKDSVTSTQSATIGGIKKAKRRPNVKSQPRSRLSSSGGSIQSLLNAASLLDGGGEQQEESEEKEGAGVSSKDPARKFSVLWNANYSPWSDEYDSITENTTTEHVEKLLSVCLSQLKSEAVVYSPQEYVSGESKSGDCDRPHPQCSVTEVIRRRKGVVADVSIPEDELVMEYNGTVTLKSDVLSSLPDKCLWRHTPSPFLYQYDKITDLDICIDARNHGNMARFIRRSCCPNSELRHFFVKDELHFGVYALNDLSPLEEVTLPFDFQHDKCEYPVECACGQVKTACLVAMGTTQSQSGSVRARGVAKPADAEEHSVPSGRGRPRSYSHILAQDEDSNSSWTSTASHSRKRKPHPPRATPLSPKLSRPTSREESSDSESEAGKRRKSLTREERKTEQVWKMFERMEASAQRKRQQLVSEGSLDSSDPLTSPLHTRQPPISSTGKERRTSSGSRRAQLLHCGKMRLSSVSSGDPLSPCDFSEAFSPPITPGLAPPASEPPSHSLTAPLLSPLTPSALKPTVEVTPYLHPKYLLEEFVLPWKKAFLRKWEMESLHNGETPAHYSYWARNYHTHHAYHMTSDLMRPRVRGSLKHRWLKQHSQDVLGEEVNGTGSDKENRRQPPLPHKKQVLLRWQESKVNQDDHVAMENSVTTEVPEESNIDIQSNERLQVPATGGESVVGVSSGRSSPLFDEFSDGEEFEFPGRKRRTSDNRSKGKDVLPSSPRMDVAPSLPSHTPPSHSPLSHSPPSHTPPSHTPPSHTPPSHGPRTPPSHGSHTPPSNSPYTTPSHGPHTPPPHSPHTPPSHGPHTPPSLSPHTPPSPITEQMDTINEENSNQPLPLSDHMMTHDRHRNESICSDISDVSINEISHTGPHTPPIPQKTTPTSPVSPPPNRESTPSQSPITAHHVNISDISSDMDSSFSHTNSEPYETDNTQDKNLHTPSLSPHTITAIPQGRSTDNATVSDVSSSSTDQVISRLGLVPEGQGSSSLSVREGQRSGSGYEDITPSDGSERIIDSRAVEPQAMMETEPPPTHASSEQGFGVEFQVGREEKSQYDAMEGKFMDNMARPHMLVEGEGTTPRGLVAPSSPSGAIRTPIKRKINLSEYRNRARKPAERKSSTEKPATPPLLTPLHIPTTNFPLLSTPSLLPNPASRQTSLDTSSVALAAPVDMTGVSAPQFEPVSPDDGDHTPPLGSLDGQSAHIQPMVGGCIVSRDLTVMDPSVVQGLPVVDHPQSVIMVGGYGQPLLQQPQGMAVQQVLWSPSGVESTHDPRRGPLLPGDRQPMFHHTPDPRSSHTQPLMAHPLQPGPHYVIPQGGVIQQPGGLVCHPGGPQNIIIMQQGEFHPHGFVSPPAHHHGPASQGYRPRLPGPGPGNNYYQ